MAHHMILFTINGSTDVTLLWSPYTIAANGAPIDVTTPSDSSSSSSSSLASAAIACMLPFGTIIWQQGMRYGNRILACDMTTTTMGSTGSSSTRSSSNVTTATRDDDDDDINYGAFIAITYRDTIINITTGTPIPLQWLARPSGIIAASHVNVAWDHVRTPDEVYPDEDADDEAKYGGRAVRVSDASLSWDRKHVLVLSRNHRDTIIIYDPRELARATRTLPSSLWRGVSSRAYTPETCDTYGARHHALIHLSGPDTPVNAWLLTEAERRYRNDRWTPHLPERVHAVGDAAYLVKWDNEPYRLHDRNGVNTMVMDQCDTPNFLSDHHQLVSDDEGMFTMRYQRQRDDNGVHFTRTSDIQATIRAYSARQCVTEGAVYHRRHIWQWPAATYWSGEVLDPNAVYDAQWITSRTIATITYTRDRIHVYDMTSLLSRALSTAAVLSTGSGAPQLLRTIRVNGAGGFTEVTMMPWSLHHVQRQTRCVASSLIHATKNGMNPTVISIILAYYID